MIKTLVISISFFLCFCLCSSVSAQDCPSQNGSNEGSYGIPPGGFTGEPAEGIEFSIRRVFPFDPNEVIGPLGYEVDQWVSVNDRLGYTVLFENDPVFATAPAQDVIIRVPIDPKLNIYSARVGSFGFGYYNFNIPPNTTFYSNRLDVSDSLDVFVDVTAGIDVTTNEVFWIFESIDPLTGLAPEDPLAGFLTVNDTTLIPFADTLIKRGEGFVTFTIEPKSTDETGDIAHVQAGIVFNENEPILTNTWTNIIDAVAPSSTMTLLPPSTQLNIVPLSWTAVDDPGGVGVGSYLLYVSKNAGQFYQHTTVDTNLYDFQGELGSSYSFYVRAVDHVGNVEEKDSSETFISIGTEPLCLQVINTNDTGLGSLRNAIDCAQPGDTIFFAPLVYNDTINLTSSRILIDKNLYVLTNHVNNIYVDASQLQKAVEIAFGSNVIIEGIKIIGGTDPEGAGVDNSGVLTLIDVAIYDSALGKVVRNTGVLTMSGLCQIFE